MSKSYLNFLKELIVIVNTDCLLDQSITISVIIPCYNSEKFLRETIESVLSQTYNNYEIIAVDDGSTDNTRSIISEYPQIKYFYQDNQGASSARNKGLKESIGEFIIFLDSDDKLLPERLQIGVEYLEENLNCAFILGWFDYIDSNGHVYDKATGLLVDVDYKTMLEGEALVSPSGCIFRKEHLLSVGGFDVNTDASEEYELYLKLSRKYPFYFHNETIFQYRRHNNNLSTKNGAMKTTRALLRVLDSQRKHLKNKDEIISYKIGKQHWKELLGPQVVGVFVFSVKRKKIKESMKLFIFLLKKLPFVTAKELWKRVLKNTIFLLTK